MNNKLSFDPRVYLISVICTSLLAVIIRDIKIIGVLLALCFVFSISQGVDLAGLWKRLKRLWQVLIFVVLMQSIFNQSGEVLFSVYNVPVLTSGGLEHGGIVLMRMTILILGGALLVNSGTKNILQAMIQLKLPYEIAYMVMVGIKFIPVFGQELKDSLTALQLRGLEIKSVGIKNRIKIYTYLLLPVTASAIARAKDLALAMEMRGFRAYEKRTSYYELKYKAKDFIMFAVIGAVLISLIFAYVKVIY